MLNLEIILKRIKYWLRRFDYANRINEISKVKVDKCVLIGTPLHRNLGDHLITTAEREFLKTIGYKKPVFEIPKEMYNLFKDRLKATISKGDLIIISGGGWMGNLFENDQLLIQDIVDSFLCKVIIFPQTIYYDTSKPKYNHSLETCKKSLEKHKNLVLCCRERNSYDLARANFNNVNTLLVPDIALSYYNLVENNIICKKSNQVAFCLRKDGEACRDAQCIDYIQTILKEEASAIVYTDTVARSRVFEEDRYINVLTKLKEFAQYQLIITDRLHGMIFAYLAGTPCIVLDNKTKKVLGVYDEWLKDSSSIMPFTDLCEKPIIGEFIKKVMANQITATYTFDKRFFNVLKKEVLDNETKS